MIVGLGLDLVEISRIEDSWRRFGMKFARRVLHPLELKDLPKNPAQYLAARFAAKEAAVKALGTGFAQGIGFQELYVSKLPSGQPEMVFLGPALKKMQQLGAGGSRLSLTHSRSNAAAVLILTSEADSTHD